MEPTAIPSPSASEQSDQRHSLIERYFTQDQHDPDVWHDPYDIEYKTVDVAVGGHTQAAVEAPESWGQNAINITSKLYFATTNGVRETSVRQMVDRVARKIADEGLKYGYFGHSVVNPVPKGTPIYEAYQAFYDELSYLLLNQMAAFNTPVWLNVGVPGRKQICSACFLLKVEDSMVEGDYSIMNWVMNEARIFKGGAGSGVNVSKLRSSIEKLSTGGLASGPTPYMRLADANAGTLKSGGAHRRAAKMVIEDVDHPDIRDFIDCKVREDKRMKILAAAGVNMDPFTPEGERNISETTSFQNANLSVNGADRFMRRATGDGRHPSPWPLLARLDGEITDTVDASNLLDEIAQAAWECADPGMVFLDTANDWHTTPSLGPITTCNPCAETWLNDDSACNLASLNLMKFIGDDGELRIEDYCRAIDVMILAMDITCSFSDLPTPAIEKNTRDLRQLGLGYANLGGALMAQGLPYDSPEGRDWALGVTALLTGRSYARSAEIASQIGAYALYEVNRESHQRVIAKHQLALPLIPDSKSPAASLLMAAHEEWARTVREGATYGYRNSQVTVIAPTGTTSHMMGCDTSGCEPAFDLVTHKGLAGGGSMTLEVGAVEPALRSMGYDEQTVDEFVYALRKSGKEFFLDLLAPEQRPVFDTANEISADGHLDMVIAISPFLSGAASKTINLHESATPKDIRDIFVKAWKGGLKAICVYRDGSKATQVLSTQAKAAADGTSRGTADDGAQSIAPERARMDRERDSITHKLNCGGHEGYITAGKYPDGSLGEIFLTGMGKEGSFLQGMMGAWSIAISIGLQYGVPLEVFANKFIGMEFEPRGATGLPEMPQATSFPDYVFRWLLARFADADTCEEYGVKTAEVKQRLTAALDAAQTVTAAAAANGSTNGYTNSNAVSKIIGTKPCVCGALMIASGTCYTCGSCGRSTGC